MKVIKEIINNILSIFFKLIPSKNVNIESYRANSIEKKLDLRIPYSNKNLINFLISFSKKQNDLKVFEFGSGSSTLFFEDYFHKVYSVEHDINWYKIIKNYTKTAEIIFETPQKTKYPKIKSKKFGFKNLDFENYVNSINKFNTKFDVIFIDGRAREECLKNAIKFVNKGGIIVIDDSSRSRYKNVIKNVKNYKKISNFYGFGMFIPLPHKATVIEF